MNVGFEFIWDETPLFIEVAKHLKKEGVDITGVTLDKRWNHLLKGLDFSLIDLASYLEENWDNLEINQQLLEHYNTTYGKNHDLWFIINVDRLINDVNAHKYPTTNDKLKLLILHLKFWERLFKEHKMCRFYSTGTSFLGLLTGMIVAENYKVKFQGVYTTRDVKGKIVFVDNYQDRWSNVLNNYLDFKKNASENLPEFQEAKNYIDSFRNSASKPSYMKSPWQIRSVNKRSFKELLNRLKYKYIYGWGKSRFDYVTPPLWMITFRGIRVIIKRSLLNKLYFKKWSGFKGKYILVPLQLQPEMSCDIHSRWYSDQINTIKLISDVLPLNYVLYVKEHAVAVGKRSGLFRYYNKMKKVPNVYLAHPNDDTFDLIKNSVMVIVTSGTVGWEALLYGKPVITLGNVFYNESGLVENVNSIKDLKSSIIKILENYELNVDMLSKYIAAVEKGTYTGYFNVPHAHEKAIHPDNVQQIRQAIMTDIEKNL